MTIREFYADRIIDFIKKYGTHVLEHIDKKTLKKYLLLHLEYQTIVVVWDKGEIAGVCAFNIDGEQAKIVECIVNPQYRNKGLLKKMTLIALERYPYLKELVFNKIKNNDGRQHEIDLNKWIKFNNGVRNTV